MSRLARGIAPGMRVKQGDVIGYAGMTGLATAPHVHYEFLRDAHQVDPRSAIRYATSQPVPKARRAEFERLRDHYRSLLHSPSEQRVLAADN